MKSRIKDKMNQIYDAAESNIPWVLEEPPRILKDLVESGKLIKCKALDVGCGVGNYSIYLAKMGFDVTGVDLSEKAIKTARSKRDELGLKINFINKDLLNDISELDNDFEFIFEWEVMHHIFPDERSEYLKNINKLLENEGKYLSVHFSENDPSFNNSEKLRKTPIGTTLYFSSLSEMKERYSEFFIIEELKELEIDGKSGKHKVILGLMTKR